MNAYLALMFCAQADLRSYAPEVAAVIQRVAGTNLKRAESAAGVSAIAFRTDMDDAAVMRAFQPLWRPEQRTWVLSLDRPVLIDSALMQWVSKPPH